MITDVPLSRLYVHPLNTRSEPPPAEIDLLAESIRSAGLLQNLMGFADPEAGFTDSADLQSRRIGIVAGGRRLRALQALYGAQPDYTVPVLITSNADTAAEWAGAENSARAALNPADEIEAYRRMRARGSSPQQIAAAFAVREAHVLRRLRLAILPVEVLDALRGGQITLDQAAALTTAPNDDAAAELLPTIIRRQGTHSPMSQTDIRRALNPAAVSLTDRRAVFVGLEYYLARGGRTQTDLFADTTAMLDPDILDSCFAEQLEQARQQELAQGWANVIAFTDQWKNYGAMAAVGPEIHRQTIDLPPADQAELDELRTADEIDDDQLARLRELDARTEGDFADDDRAAATAFIGVNGQGSLVFWGAHRPREAAADGGADASIATTAPAETIPNSLREDLRIIATLSLQTALLDRTELVLDLLALCLDPSLPAWALPLAISPTPQAITPRQTRRMPHRRAPAKPRWRRPGRAVDRHADRRAGRRQTRAQCNDHRGSGAHPERRAQRFRPRPGRAAACQPAHRLASPAENYFKRLPAGMLDAIWQELVPDDQISAPGITALKKAEKAAQLHRLFHDTDFRESCGLSRAQNAAIDAWLPPELRFGFEGRAA